MEHSMPQVLGRPLACLVIVTALTIAPGAALAAPGPGQPAKPTPAPQQQQKPAQAQSAPQQQQQQKPPQQQQQQAPQQQQQNAPQQQPTWAVTLGDSGLHAGPSQDSDILASAPAQTLVQVLGYSGDFAYVANPRTHETAYVASDVLAPSDPPSPYLTMAPPPMKEEFDPTSGVVTDPTALDLFPTTDQQATDHPLNPNTWLTLTGTVDGTDGQTWYRTQDGDYVLADAVFVPARIDDFSGRWLDVNLSTPARVAAYEGNTPVRSFLTIKGAGPRPTPIGVFTILRRVANETMNSDTIGIPRNGPGGYYLTNVLFTQYFTGDGASLHYNYWSSMWGYPGSHGCLGLTYADSAWLWDWAHIGTPVDIHY
jgi:L,D-transpeptidase catalytic domain